MAGTEQKIELSIEETLAVISINRADKLNALSWEMMRSLQDIAGELDLNRSIRAVIIRSLCPRAFGVGADINDWGSLEPIDMWRVWTRHGHRVIRSIEELSQPVIAVVNGFAFGGSLELALAADVRIGETGSQYGFPEARVGTIPGWLGTQKALQLVGPGTLKKMIFTGQPLSAEEALQSGLINELTAPGEGMRTAREMAAAIAANSPVSVSLAKQIVNSLSSSQSVTALESFAGGLAAQSADGREGKESFREKRPPSFSGS